jgi:hypothetical protein
MNAVVNYMAGDMSTHFDAEHFMFLMMFACIAFFAVMESQK